MNHLKFCPKCGEKTLIFDGEKILVVAIAIL
jgi:ribosomal protein S27AE